MNLLVLGQTSGTQRSHNIIFFVSFLFSSFFPPVPTTSTVTNPNKFTITYFTKTQEPQTRILHRFHIAPHSYKIENFTRKKMNQHFGPWWPLRATAPHLEDVPSHPQRTLGPSCPPSRGRAQHSSRHWPDDPCICHWPYLRLPPGTVQGSCPQL